MAFAKWDPKDPDEILDYQIEWAVRLDGDTITASTWLVPDGLTEGSDTFNDDTTTIWLSGGTVGTTYEVTNRVETAGGRTMDMTVKLACKVK